MKDRVVNRALIARGLGRACGSSNENRDLLEKAAVEVDGKVQRDSVFRDGSGPLGILACEEEEAVWGRRACMNSESEYVKVGGKVSQEEEGRAIDRFVVDLRSGWHISDGKDGGGF